MSRIVTIGDSFSNSASFTAEQVSDFAKACGDANPLHHDLSYARDSGHAALVVSAAQLSSQALAFISRHFSSFAQPQLLEFNLRFVKPALAGDTLNSTWTVVDAFWKDELGGDVATLEGSIINNRELVVAEGTARTLVRPRTPVPPRH